MTHDKCFVIEPAIDFTSILFLLGDFLFVFDTITSTRFIHELITALCTLFMCFSFDITKMSLTSWTEHQEALSSA